MRILLKLRALKDQAYDLRYRWNRTNVVLKEVNTPRLRFGLVCLNRTSVVLKVAGTDH